MKKTLKIIMAIILFIAAIGIASGVEAKSLAVLEQEKQVTVSSKDGVTTYELTSDYKGDKIEIDRNVVLDLGAQGAQTNIVVEAGANATIKTTGSGKTIKSLEVAGEVKVEGSSTIEITKIEVKAGGKVEVKDATVVAGTNAGNVEINGASNVTLSENTGDITLNVGVMNVGSSTGKVVANEGTIVGLTMNGGEATIGSGVTLPSAATSFVVNKGKVVSEIDLNGKATISGTGLVYVYSKEANGRKYYVVDKTELEFGLKAVDSKTAKDTTTFEKDKTYLITPVILLNGEEITNLKVTYSYDKIEMTVKPNGALVRYTEGAENEYIAVEDGEAVFELKAGEGNTEIKGEVEVTVGEVAQEDPEAPGDETEPGQNEGEGKGELDSTPKTGEHI